MSVERVIQEYVPGKQITIAHVIANPDGEVRTKIGANQSKGKSIGIMKITPSEMAIIAVDLAVKSADVEVDFIDRFTGSLIVSGEFSAVKESLDQTTKILKDVLDVNVKAVSMS